MQPVNDDMDNLFRQAADNYPLNTQGADFDKLLQRMDAADDTTAPKKESRRRYGWLLLLLLLPLPFLCRHYYSPEVENSLPIARQQPDKNAEQSTAVSIPKVFTTEEIATDTPNTPTTNTLTNTGNSIESDKAAQSGSFGNNIVPAQQSRKEDNRLSQKNSITPVNEIDVVTIQNVRASSGTNHRLSERKNQKHNNSYLVVETSDADRSDKLAKTETASHSFREMELASGIALPATKRSRQPDSILQTDSTTHLHLANKPSDTATIAIDRKAAEKDSSREDSASSVKKQTATNNKVKPFFYAGLIGGIDYSVVKSKQTAGTGYSTGLVAGYRLGKHWAVETGLLWDHKKYRAEGEYIDTAGLGLAMHTQVFNANGSCSILEIPLSVQYHFSSKKQSHWYVGAGLSSYLIKKEEYYYIGKRYNMVYYAEREYTNSTKNWFSVLQLGGGYQWQLGKQSSLQAEPYIKLPLSKIGIAKLPLSSAGINIGYIRPL